MSRFLLLALATTLTACGPSASGLDPDAAIEAADAALAAHDTERALNLLAEAADQGHLGAMRRLAEAYERGYIRATRGTPTIHLPIRTWPGQAALATRRFERALADGVQKGDDSALYLEVDRLMSRTWIDGEWQDPTPADLDSAAAIYHRLADTEAGSLSLALLAERLGRRGDFERHLDAAAEAGDAMACAIRFWSQTGGIPRVTETVAAAIDDAEACRERAGEDAETELFAYGVQIVTGLAEEAASGNADSAAMLDSLRVEGVFDRHPRLGALFAEAES